MPGRRRAHGRDGHPRGDRAGSEVERARTGAEASGTHSSRRMNQLAEAMGATSYLEIGVARGTTFRDIRVPNRTGVDPRFRGPTEGLEGPGVRLEHMTSDGFFAALPADVTYDIVFIDGLHVFEQAYRDFCNAILHTHVRSVIVLDDTLPSDESSALRDRKEAYRLRRNQTGSTGRAWHGDVYKVVYAIHEFHLGLDYATVTVGGHPQTIVWRAQNRRQPRGWSFADISAMTYARLQEDGDGVLQVHAGKPHGSLALDQGLVRRIRSV
jgi:hypothetical protein